MLFYLPVTLVSSVLLLLHLLWLGHQGRPGPEQAKTEMRKHLVWRLFYMNPEDPRGWVPKTWGFGWTVNFRSMEHIAIFITLVSFTLGSALATTWSAFCSMPCGG